MACWGHETRDEGDRYDTVAAVREAFLPAEASFSMSAKKEGEMM
jgi:hypothetical protein